MGKREERRKRERERWRKIEHLARLHPHRQKLDSATHTSVTQMSPSRVRSWIRGLRTEHLLQGRLSQGEITALQNSQKRAATAQFPRKGLVITQSCNNYDPRAGFCPTGQAMALGSDRKYVSLSVSWRGKWQPTPVFLPGGFHGQRSLVGCCP